MAAAATSVAAANGDVVIRGRGRNKTDSHKETVEERRWRLPEAADLSALTDGWANTKQGPRGRHEAPAVAVDRGSQAMGGL